MLLFSLEFFFERNLGNRQIFGFLFICSRLLLPLISKLEFCYICSPFNYCIDTYIVFHEGATVKVFEVFYVLDDLFLDCQSTVSDMEF